MPGHRRERRLCDEAVRSASAVFREYGGFIRTVIRFQARRRFDEEDVFQEFFLSLVRKPMPVNVRDIKSFLYRAIINHIVDLIRRQGSYQRSLKKYAKETRICINSRPPRSAVPVDDREEREATVAHFARHLQDREAQAFVLRYRDNCTNAEIAAKMGVNLQTVRRYLSSGLRRLRETLAT